MGSIGQVAGMVVGGIIGWFAGGQVYAGAMLGAAIGGGIGTYIDPPSYSMPDMGKPDLQDITITMASEGALIPDVLGTTKITGNVMHYWGANNIGIYEAQEGGKGGSDAEMVLVGHNYYLSWLQGICVGPIDTLYSIYLDEELVWYGELVRPESGGVETITLMALSNTGTYETETSSYTGLTVAAGTIYGNIQFYFGTNDQMPNSDIEETGENRNIPYRGICYAFFDNFLIGEYNRAPIVKFVLGKYPVCAFNEFNKLNTFDYNPAHAIYEILVTMAYIPVEFIDENSFSEVANLLMLEGIGIGQQFDKAAPAIDYINQILFSFDAMTYYDTDGKIHLRLLRDTE